MATDGWRTEAAAAREGPTVTPQGMEALRALSMKWRDEAMAYPVVSDERAAFAAAAVRLCADELDTILSSLTAAGEGAPSSDNKVTTDDSPLGLVLYPSQPSPADGKAQEPV